MIDKKWITWFNKNKTSELYENIEIEHFPNDKKCTCCNKSIYYYDSTYAIGKDKKLKKIKKSCNSIKKINNIEYHLVVCEKCLSNKFPEYLNKNKSRVFNMMNNITAYAFNITKTVQEDWFNLNYKRTGENYIKKFGKIEGEKRWKNYCNKQAYSNSYEYKKEKYGWNKNQYNEYNSSRAITVENLIKKHGELKGLEIWNNYIERQRYTCTLNYFIEKYGELKGGNKYDNFCKQRSFQCGYSEVATCLFDKLNKHLKRYKTYYSTHNGEYFIKDGYNYYMLDFYIKELNLAIEFNGNVWHGNPEIYTENDKPNPFNKKLTAKEIWEKDEYRLNIIKKRIKKVIIIWEKDLKEKGEDTIIEQLLETIKTLK